MYLKTITDKSMSKESQAFGAKVVSMLEQANSDIIERELSVAA
jgi:hypothetical protein